VADYAIVYARSARKDLQALDQNPSALQLAAACRAPVLALVVYAGTWSPSSANHGGP